jgi:hypothetical protein
MSKSLVHHASDTLRYDVHELLRQYASEHLAAERAPVEQRYADYYLALVEQAEPHLSGADQLTWFRRVEDDYANVLAGLHWLLERRHVEPALRLSGALGRFWQVWPHVVGEGKQWLKVALALSDQAMGDGSDDQVYLQARAKVLLELGNASFREPASFAHIEQAYELYLRLGDERGQADALISRGFFAVFVPAEGGSIPQTGSAQNAPFTQLILHPPARIPHVQSGGI